jgi:hypothetical protein
MARIYIASSWRNKFQPGMVRFLRDNGHEVYDFRHPEHSTGFQWIDIGLDPLRCTADEYRRAILTHPRAAQGYMSDFRAMEWADTCVLLLPCGRSAHLEGGWFAGRGKRLIIHTRDGEEPELMALMALHIVINSDELLRALTGNKT